MKAHTVIVRAGKSQSERDATEELLVIPEGDALRLLRSPGLTLGIAADDIFTVDEWGDPRVLRRGGNVCVQVFFTNDGPEVKAAALAALADIEARLDGESDHVVVFTIPVAVGFQAIEKRLALLMTRCPTGTDLRQRLRSERPTLGLVGWIQSRRIEHALRGTRRNALRGSLARDSERRRRAPRCLDQD